MTKNYVCIIDYGSGNLRSAAKAFERVITNEAQDLDVQISDRADDVLKAERLVLPGQGAFADCMAGLRAQEGVIEALEERVLEQGVPFLGICVGMQLMVTRGHEHEVTPGLDWIRGEVVPMHEQARSEHLKIPHMGWNELFIPGPGEQDNRHPLLRSYKTDDHYYFVHSFMVQCRDARHELGYTDYGGPVTAVIGRDNMAGVQFHPEKSQGAGLRLISDFLLWQP